MSAVSIESSETFNLRQLAEFLKEGRVCHVWAIIQKEGIPWFEYKDEIRINKKDIENWLKEKGNQFVVDFFFGGLKEAIEKNALILTSFSIPISQFENNLMNVKTLHRKRGESDRHYHLKIVSAKLLQQKGFSVSSETNIKGFGIADLTTTDGNIIVECGILGKVAKIIKGVCFCKELWVFPYFERHNHPRNLQDLFRSLNINKELCKYAEEIIYVENPTIFIFQKGPNYTDFDFDLAISKDKEGQEKLNGAYLKAIEPGKLERGVFYVPDDHTISRLIIESVYIYEGRWEAEIYHNQDYRFCASGVTSEDAIFRCAEKIHKFFTQKDKIKGGYHIE